MIRGNKNMEKFFASIIYSFFISFGIVLGGSLFATFGAIINGNSPLKIMLNVANSIKIWAIATALGGTFSSFEIFEEGLFNGNFKSIGKQIIYIIFAFIGANMAVEILRLFEKSGRLWMK